ncbi:hypothetical protein [Aliamphritea spongicola]|uniref:hypothetical protein n=1 Tax=Aliamphritea spongicola TaxID=707589 RepID=UPI00196A615C|nr:hypothetical protein [Aliamphritea spongicola]MBN3562929.1 hypothetical protein [Aliamphritea spongicola]
MDTQRTNYIAALELRLMRFYMAVRDTGVADEVENAGIKAFMEAGVITEVVTTKDLEDIIERQHMSAFGMTLDERYQKRMAEAQEKGDFEFFDKPAWERQGKRVSLSD